MKNLEITNKKTFFKFLWNTENEAFADRNFFRIFFLEQHFVTPVYICRKRETNYSVSGTAY